VSGASLRPARSALHVLPHPGGGGETYVDLLAGIEGWRAGRISLARDAGEAHLPGLLMRGLGSVTWQSGPHDLLHVHGEAAAGLCLPALALRPSVVTLHGLHLLRRVQGARRALAAANLRAVVRAASRTICVSQAEHDDLVQVLGPALARRAVVILNGVRATPPPAAGERAAARAALGLGEGDVAGLFVGALDTVKDPLTAARAALQVGGTTLLFAGAGPLRAELEAVANTQGGLRVLGQRDDLRSLHAAADFLVLPSLREGLSFAVLEAMAAGLPAVVSDAPGNPEAVGDTGIVAARGDVAGFAGAFARLRDAGLRADLGARARARAAQAFTAERMQRETKSLYEDVAGEKRRM
jgi:glycosyltransferase involved in cell wall biosynthesis